jgi:cellulose synthase/poly-beta-1,6-N-acetylglucosamine synthase-like glycosyltransferase
MELIIVISALSIFTARTLIFLVGSIIEKRKNDKIIDNHYQPFVSVIVPARNEENNIGKCLDSLLANKYGGQYEIIIVNDRSEDSTAKILAEYSAKSDVFKIVTIEKDSDKKNLRGKPGALQAGIELALGEVILMTDADCIVPEKWIEFMVKPYANKNTGLVAAFSHTFTERIFDKIQAVYWIYLHVMGSAGFGLRVPLGCIGNNLSVRTDTIRKLGGYSSIKFSVTEDLSLLQAVTDIGSKVNYLSYPETTVETNPSRNLKEFLRQLHRWSIGGLELGWKGAVFVISSIALWIGIITAAVFADLPWLIIILGMKIIGDFALIVPALISIQKKGIIKWVPLAIFFFFLLELFVPIQLLDKKVVWKEQVFRR